MPKQSKSKTEVSETPSAVTIHVDASVEKATKNTMKQPKSVAPTQPVVAPTHPVVAPTHPVVAPTHPVVAPTHPTESAEFDTTELTSQTNEFFTKITQLGSLIALLKTEYRSLEKKWSREIKTAQKTNSKRKRKSGNRQPSGFVKPTKISDELAKFLDKPSGTEMARTDVTREINKYIRSHNLQDKENGRKINPDTKLQVLLKIQKTDELTYFNLQRYMSPHFHKTDKTHIVSSSV